MGNLSSKSFLKLETGPCLYEAGRVNSRVNPAEAKEGAACYIREMSSSLHYISPFLCW